MFQINNLFAPLRAFAPSRESITQLGRARALGAYLTRRREDAEVGVSICALLLASQAHANERCLMAEYRSPESIRAEMSPYMTCGLLDRSGHFSTRVNGQGLTMEGPSLQACSTVRQIAVQKSDLALIKTIPKDSKRRAFVQAEFEKADQFLRAAVQSYDLGVGQPANAPKCRKSSASNQ